MITQLKVYSSLASAPTLLLDSDGALNTDLLEIRDISGLDPVKASVNTSPYGLVDGAAYLGSSIQTRNIVLKIGKNPDYDENTYESLRDLLYAYFLPKRPVRLVLYSDNKDPVQIDGIVEDVSDNMFSKDPEHIVSIICPRPHFISVSPITLEGETNESFEIFYEGNVEAGFVLTFIKGGDGPPTEMGIEIGDTYAFYVLGTLGADESVKLSTLALEKYIRTVVADVETSILQNVYRIDNDIWPVLQPGSNEVLFYTNPGTHSWQLVYHRLYGGL